MQKFAGLCTPEQLHTLQRVFDLIWMELRANGHANYNGPSDPDELRDEIARRVFAEYDGEDVIADNVTKRVLGSFGVSSDQIGPQTVHPDGTSRHDRVGKGNGRWR
jgi:hypothetical protein